MQQHLTFVDNLSKMKLCETSGYIKEEKVAKDSNRSSGSQQVKVQYEGLQVICDNDASIEAEVLISSQNKCHKDKKIYIFKINVYYLINYGK